MNFVVVFVVLEEYLVLKTLKFWSFKLWVFINFAILKGNYWSEVQKMAELNLGILIDIVDEEWMRDTLPDDGIGYFKAHLKFFVYMLWH